MFFGMVVSPVALAQENDIIINERVDASEEVIDSFVSNEYDYVMKLKQTPDAKLKKMGYTTEEIVTIKEFSFEEAFLERAQLTEIELYGLGYNADQITLLKAYDGSSLEDNLQMRGLIAKVTGNITRGSYTPNKSLETKFNWEWNTAPLLSGSQITEIVTCGFAGIKSDNGFAAVYSNSSSCKIDYYGTDAAGVTRIIGNKSHTVNSTSNGVEVKFRINEGFGYSTGWAKKGTFTVRVREVYQINDLKAATFAYGYGHSSITASPSISISISGVSVGLNFGKNVNPEFYERKIMYSSNGSMVSA